MEKTNKSWERNWQNYILETKIKKQTNLKENDYDNIQALEDVATSVENLYDKWDAANPEEDNVKRVLEFVEQHLGGRYGDY
jgi:hypothetical protein